ncbi:DUF2635 domain-containing protein [Roseospira navarrensis]|uniref:DUF2635 domain-containing protein n=1 Tax=Roseospira navarrensis TaxID=140058 RepID=A0A7X2D310_9PROT|nr:DUF2635 domain-containing protein [Roseospira navarrensis]MQX36819.1 DUF2635 domain-containing protein [Roseospira navarrensis]
MPETRTLKPARPGLLVRMPPPAPGAPPGRLPDEGLAVTWSIFWQRRLSAGDVVEVRPTKTRTKES